MKKAALTLAGAILAASVAGSAFAQTAAPAAPDATAAAPVAKAATPKKHQKVAMNKHTGAKPAKRARAKQPAPATEEPSSE